MRRRVVEDVGSEEGEVARRVVLRRPESVFLLVAEIPPVEHFSTNGNVGGRWGERVGRSGGEGSGKVVSEVFRKRRVHRHLYVRDDDLDSCSVEVVPRGKYNSCDDSDERASCSKLEDPEA